MILKTKWSFKLTTDYSLKLLISEDEIKAKVLEIGKILNKLYKDQELTILIVMKGAICFAADLITASTIVCA